MVAEEALNYIGNGASVIGAVVPVWVLVIANNVRRFFYRKTRIPILRDGIKEKRAQIGACQRQPDTVEVELREHLSVCYSNLKSLRSKVPSKVRREINKTSKLIDQALKPSALSKEDVNAVYQKLIVIETDVSNWLGDLGSDSIQ
jgi:hypothetical protein